MEEPEMSNSEQEDWDDDDEVVTHDDHEEHDGEPWLVSYADLMTLLFGFFVLMYTFALAENTDEPQNMVSMRKEVAEYFGGAYVSPLEKELEEFQKAMVSENLGKEVDIKHSPEGAEIILQSKSLFDSGTATMKPSADKAIHILGKIISEKDTNYAVRVEGHTDNVPVSSSNRFRSNWELSGARAASVIEILESEGIAPAVLIGVGYGSSRPLAPNNDKEGRSIEENQAKNRRVRILVTFVSIDKPKKGPGKPTTDVTPPANSNAL